MTSSTAPPDSKSTVTRSGRLHRGTDLTAQLDREWSRLRRRPHALHEARAWQARLGNESTVQRTFDLTGVDDLDQIIHATHAGRGAAGEQLLRSLVTISADDQLAGRLLVQRLLPGVLATVSRYRGLCEHDDPIGEAVGALWIAIATFDVERRGGPAAASIISDTTYLAFRRRVRLRSADEEPVPPNTLDEEPTTATRCSFVELADIVGNARRAGVPTHDLELIRHLVRAESPGLVARQRQVTPRTVRNHRDRAIEHIRHAVGIAAA